MNYLIKDTTLTAIGDAVRAKGNTEDKILVSDLATAISNLPTGGGGGGVEVEPIILTGNCQYSCGGAIAGAYIGLYGNTITTQKISDLSYMCKDYIGESIPFDLNCVTTASVGANYVFDGAKNLKVLPKINNFKPSKMGSFFNNCYNLRTIPEDFASNWDWSSFHTNYYGDYTAFFQNCYSLRSIPQTLLKELWSGATTSSYVVSKMFYSCYALDEINGFNFDEAVEWKNNVFSNTFAYCTKLSNLIFAVNEDGAPKIAKWKSQTIDLSFYAGYSISTNYFTNYNSGLMNSNQIYDDATYQERKNGDWFSAYMIYSRYNHDSAVNTINSLPDTSAYLATAGGTNTIKFKGAAGSKTDGGAINTLTEEEIAVATAKGWTVSLV